MDLNTIMNLAKNLQGSLSGATAETKNKLKQICINTSVGGGAVYLQMDGLYQVVQLDINPDLLKQEEKQILQDLLILAFNQAAKEVKTKQKVLFSSMGLPMEILEGIL